MAHSVETSKSSGSLGVGATQVIRTRPAKISGIVLTPAAAAASITVYDNRAASAGTVVATLKVAASVASVIHLAALPIECLDGITVDVTGTGALAYVYYSDM